MREATAELKRRYYEFEYVTCVCYIDFLIKVRLLGENS